MTTMTALTGKVGFASPMSNKTFSKRRHAGVELIATVALAACLIVAATAVSIGMAHAQALGTVGDGDAPFAVVLLIGMVMTGMGVLTVFAARGPGSDSSGFGPNSRRRSL
jgi:hypothetical protein